MPPKKQQKKSSKAPPGGRAGNVGGMVNSVISEIIQKFILLSEKNRRETLEVLSRIAAPLPERTQESGKDGSTNDDRKPAAKQKSARLPAWDRPEVKDLPYAKRQKDRPKADRDSSAGRDDGKLISAALAAANRSKMHQISAEDLKAALLGAGEDLSQIRSLYPKEEKEPEGDETKGTGIVPVAPGPTPLGKPPLEVKVTLKGQDGTTHEISSATYKNILRATSSREFKDGMRITIVTDIVSALTTLRGDEKRFRLRALPESEFQRIQNPEVATGNRTLLDLARAFAHGETVNIQALQDHTFYRVSDKRIVFVNLPGNWASDDEEEVDDDKESDKGRPLKRPRTET